MMIGIFDIALLYMLLGLLTLLFLIRASHGMPDDERSESLGKIVVYGVIGWPYVLVVWLFSLPFWLCRIELKK